MSGMESKRRRPLVREAFKKTQKSVSNVTLRGGEWVHVTKKTLYQNPF